MKYFKNTLVAISVLTALVMSVEWGYALDENYSLKTMSATSNKTIEIILNKSIWLDSSTITSDLQVYQDTAVKDNIKDWTNPKKVQINLMDSLIKNTSY